MFSIPEGDFGTYTHEQVIKLGEPEATLEVNDLSLQRYKGTKQQPSQCNKAQPSPILLAKMCVFLQDAEDSLQAAEVQRRPQNN